MRKNVLIHTVNVLDGIGDLILFINWFKLFRKYYKHANEKIVIIARDKDSVVNFLSSLYDLEAIHPIFEFIHPPFDTKNPYFYGEDDIFNTVAKFKGCLSIVFCDFFKYEFVLQDFFTDIAIEDHVSVFNISICRYNTITNAGRLPDFEKYITEFDLEPSRFALGLGEDNLGLLTDINGINGNEDIAQFLTLLSPATKEIIFENTDISSNEAIEYLSNTPSIFAYLKNENNMYALQEALCSPIMQAAIRQGKVPLFFITGSMQLTSLPVSVKLALEKKQIRVIFKWLNNQDYNAVSGIFFNKLVNSIIVPSGDNTLMLCVKTGKLPLYAHRTSKEYDVAPDFKRGMFVAMRQIMGKARDNNLINDHPGFNACNEILTSLAKGYKSNSSVKQKTRLELLYSFCAHRSDEKVKEQYYSGIAQHLTSDARNFFRDELAPYIMENFDFEKKSLPRLINELKQQVNELKQQEAAHTPRMDVVLT